jgi:two-component system chemotaxis sensor kinase CheA
MTNDKFIETFKEEALELLGNLESTLLELEENPGDKELLSAVFRVMHTIKGSAAMFGLDLISSFAHEVESILSALRDGKLSVSKELIGNTLEARDLILGMLEPGAVSTGPLSQELQEFLDAFKVAVGFSAAISPEKTDPGAKPVEIVPEKTKVPSVWRVRFKPGKDLFRRGTNPLSVIGELRNFGESVCIPLFDDVPVLSALNPEDCLVAWEVYVTTTASENDIRDIFIFVEDCSEVSVECLDDKIDENSIATKKLGEILIENGKLERSALDRILQSQKRIGEILVEENLVSPTEIKVALEEQKQIQKAVKSKTLATDMSTIRVKSEKLDQLMSLVGELV